MAEDGDYHVPVPYERCDHVERPFFHGTKAAFEVGDELVPGSNCQQGRTSNNIYVAAALETAVMGSGTCDGACRERVTRPPLRRGATWSLQGRSERDQHKVSRQPDGAYRTGHPLHVVAKMVSWEGRHPGVPNAMLNHLARRWGDGLDVIGDYDDSADCRTQRCLPPQGGRRIGCPLRAVERTTAICRP